MIKQSKATHIDNINLVFVGNKCILLQSQGNRMNMEDFHIIEIFMDIKIFGLFDGHNGKNISKKISMLSKNFNKYIYKYFKKNINYNEFIKIINNKFIELDKQLFNNIINQGSTLHILYIHDNDILIINLGDSKTQIYDNQFKCIFETIQHRPDNNIEKKRIENTKFPIINNNGIFRINNEISLSRSFGDFKYKIINDSYNGIESAISIIPNIYNFNISYEYSYLIIATDGFWDFINNDEIYSVFIKYYLSKLEEIAKILIRISINNGSNDNISIIIIKQ